MAALRAHILEAKSLLATGLERLKAEHNAGRCGVELCAAASDLRDEVLRGLYAVALEGLSAEQVEAIRDRVALVAHGGYGRREVAPYSDVDLMILCEKGLIDQVAPLAERLLCDVFDTGLVLGHSVRTIDEACTLACQDAQICTSLIESRLLEGSQALFGRYLQRFRRRIRRRAAALVAAIDKSRREERLQFGETVYLLEPNIKRSRGGLREIHLIRWIGEVSYGSTDLGALSAQGVLQAADAAAIQRANEFLLWLRNEMHFHAGKAGDVLSRGEQLRIAELKGYEAWAGMLPVELFMRDYFRHTDQVSHVATRFLDKARPSPPLETVGTALFSHRVEGGFRAGLAYLTASHHARQQLRGDLAAILRLVDLANLYNKPIDPETWEVVRQEAPRLPAEIPAEALAHFWSLLGVPARLGELLRALHEVGILEKFIPAFSHARGLLQFNQYHKYTVDEHSFRAVDQATDFLHDPGPFGQVYRKMSSRNVLHLALLIHDLGKGYPQDHCETGLVIAADTAQRLKLEPRDAEALKFLVHKHLMMNHLVFRRDTSDEQLVLRFAAEVGSPELLEKLYILTAADLGAVGPDTWTDWKAEVVTELYERTMEHLAGEAAGIDLEEQMAKRRDLIRQQLDHAAADPWYVRQVAALPAGYLNVAPPAQIAADLRLLRGLGQGEVEVQAAYQPETGTVQFTVATSEGIVPGVFHRLTGALSSQGLEILSAQINTLADGLVLDRFRVIDGDYAGEPPAERLDGIRRALAESLTAPGGKPPVFRRKWMAAGGQRPAAAADQTRVRWDNSTSESFTILDIFTADRPGLLYAISRAIFELGLSVGRAKIGTYLDQVADVFYVTDQSGHKIHDEARLDAIRSRLQEAIQGLESREA
jgi:[protein-PII] uridylyltransferase